MADEFPDAVKKAYLGQVQEFNVARPVICPYCKNDPVKQDGGLTWEFEEFIGTDEVKVRVTCEKCANHWFEYYTLTDIFPGSDYEEVENGKTDSGS